MPSPINTTPKRSFEISDVYYILCRHKWKITICTLIGLAAAGVYYQLTDPPFRSIAKLMVRFVVIEGRNLGPNNDDATAKSPDQRGETIMAGEREILTSTDLARRVAEAVGPDKILAKVGGGSDLGRAASRVQQGLTVTIPTRTNIIRISYEHPDYDIVQPVLREVIETYLKLHQATHRTSPQVMESLVRETDQLRLRLAQTEDDLRKARRDAGVVSLETAKQSYADAMNKIRDQIFAQRAEVAAQTAILEEYNKRNPDKPQMSAPTEPESTPPTPAVTDEFRNLAARLNHLRQNEQVLLTQFTAESSRVKEIRDQIAQAENRRAELVAAHPALARAAVSNTGAQAAAASHAAAAEQNAFAALAQISAAHARIRELQAQLDLVKSDAAKADQLEARIIELTRQKELDETSYRYLQSTLEQHRIRETLGNGRVSNIVPIQTPSAAFMDYTMANKITLALAGAGLVLGLVWAVAIELLFDRTLRRPKHVERQLDIPLFLTIPIFKSKGKKTTAELPAAAAAPNGSSALMPANGAGPAVPEEATRVFHETLRDRLIGYFESKGLTHKPKLVAVTGVSPKAGVTSIAAGLARSLSETGDGNVLLVDFTNRHGSSQQFSHGRSHCELDELFEARDNAQVETNLYVVNEGKNNEQLSRQLPQRFSKIVPKLKASDFDYIIFDMPTVSQISITPRLANYMDMVLLVAESEKTNQDVAERAVSLLRNSKAHLGLVMNKTRSYIPAALDNDLLTSA